ncbi:MULTISPECIES: homoprotocatechuate degradation operon regulator HpaR [unclassified Iodobacter]|uniref:homoprotocatechuate degradation operon regulator HpaR n=1 Tax=unclassified Iodobacter TaxID=235634 RepID=UPI0025F61FB8|nr:MULTISPECIES: homoprotocatechuate degradation operon regulator HpaR [unclassified Iodobacter]MDW5416637.1 homoprotocatechuate degradation operon regulator HpaR [Iodobacter sp. CM08]
MKKPLKHRNLALLLLQAREVVMARFRPILNHHNITEQQWRIIRSLSERGMMEPREICENCQILSPSLTGVLARMGELGLVTRTRMDTDQRRVNVRLTAKSERLFNDIAPLIEQEYLTLESEPLGANIEELYAALDRFLANSQNH